MKLHDLLSIEDEKRDLAWEMDFFHAFTESDVYILNEEPQVGPDGWPYLIVKTLDYPTEPGAGNSIESNLNKNTNLNFASNGKSESVQKILYWLSSRGIGMVVNPEKSYPDFVFTFGMIWHFRETGRFYGPNQTGFSNEYSVAPIEQVQFGTPSESFLPKTVRKILKQYFAEYGVLGPRIGMSIKSIQGTQQSDLIFSAESIGNPEPSNYQAALEAISWFLPPHYSLALVREIDLPTGVFTDL